ncbi:MAG: N-acetylglucosamine-6-phosphate deacetylase [Verrucomicrobia bacterium]|nr:N-acetylglucosamine-6-phosphate deacetylase [Verrucomicrobiota bacterium]
MGESWPILRARRLDNRETVSISRDADHVRAIEPAPSSGDDEWWLAPVLCDLQVNGFAGVDFQRLPLESEPAVKATEALARHGCGVFLPTLVTDAWPRLLSKLGRLATLRASHEALRAAWAGWHVEGPFLSDQPGFHGAHDPAKMEDPSPEKIRELRDAAGDLPVLLTLAPERPGAIASIREAVRLGMRVSLGHTDASARQLAEARAAGASLFTHLGNAIPKELDRHDNVLWRVLDQEGFRVMMIPDSVHVSPPLFRLAHRLQGEHGIGYVTDAMSAAGAPPGRYPLGNLELEVGLDLVVREPGKSNFSGSALTPVEGVRRAAMMLRGSWQEAWERFSTLPARWMGLDLGFGPSPRADFCLVRADGDNAILEVEVFRKGRRCGGASFPDAPEPKPFRLIRPEDRGM